VPERARIIATIHAYAEWLAEHPEVPAPHNIVAHHHVTAGTLSERIDAVERFAAANEIEPWRSGSTVGCRLTVMSAAYPVEVEHTVLCSTDAPL
jgi:hypothetical protein